MQGKRLLRSLGLTNLLSYGSRGMELDLEPLNVLIGPNASGKSNLIEALTLLAATPLDLGKPIREGGGIFEWLWKGSVEPPNASIEANFESPEGSNPCFYGLSLTAAGPRFQIFEESLRDNQGQPLFRREGGRWRYGDLETWNDIDPQRSIFSHLKDPVHYPQLTAVGAQLDRIRFFRDWNFGRGSAARRPQQVDLPDDFLLEDASNLGLVLNNLQNRLSVKRLLLEKLQLFYERMEEVTTQVQGGTIQIFFHETGLETPIPAARLSDGTLHYLCLLTILCHPEPPPLICLEEPEIGLHPDALPVVAELLIDAAQRSQLVVTTHSDVLVSALSDVPEAVVVCERDDEGTTLRRLEPAKLKEWLERYKLGELWSMGEIGGLAPPRNHGLLDWLRACPEKDFFVPTESESTDTEEAMRAVVGCARGRLGKTSDEWLDETRGRVEERDR